jgi:hypothetical protein
MNDDGNLTIRGFCEHEKISRSFYFRLRNEGRGPREMRMGRWIRITPEARREWRAARETEARNTTTEAA